MGARQSIPATSAARIIVTGLIAQHPLLGGMTWHYLHYILGLKQLGFDVHYVEDSGEWPYNLHGGESGRDYSAASCRDNVEFLSGVMARFGLEDRWAYRCPINREWSGRKPDLKSVDLLLNVSGTLAQPEDYSDVRTLAYIDTDPVFTQIKLAHGQAEFKRAVDAHEIHFSFGECIGPPLPSTGHRWLPTRQPVVLSEWRADEVPRDVFTTVMNWSSYTSESFNGQTYGQKDIEFARFLELPNHVSAKLEIAVRGTKKGNLPGVSKGRRVGDLPKLLKSKGWQVVDATRVCSDFSSYRRHIQSSRAEWTVAKNAYAAGKSGWFSDRSACYLAAGRPVVVQDTGFRQILPTGRGLLAFDTLEEAVEGIRQVQGNYEAHARAAGEIAREYFDAPKVLSHLVERALQPVYEGTTR